MDVISILNTIRSNNSDMYMQRIPEATADNLQAVGQAIMEYEAQTNEFLNALVNRIAFTIVSNRRFKNPLAVLKKGGKPFGTDIEELYTNPVTGVTYDGSETSDMLNVTKPDTKAIFHRMNRQDKYPVSISAAALQKAFTGMQEMNKFITSVITAMYSGDEMDEFILMKALVSDAIENDKMQTYTIDSWTGSEEDCKGLVKVMKTLSSNFTFPSRHYNGYSEYVGGLEVENPPEPCITWTPKENQLILIRSDIDAATDVEVLAKAFNMDKTDFMARKIVVDNFIGADDPYSSGAGGYDTLAVICDEAMFQVYDDLYQVRSFDNGSNLTTNYWLHHWQTMSLSLFANAVAIQVEIPADPEYGGEDEPPEGGA